jgi:hypothetical protein
MRLLALFGIVATCVVGLLLAASAQNQNPQPPVKGFAVHEWGVFTVSADLATMNADQRAELEALPKFMYGQMTTRELPKHFIPVRVRKPVVFFHAPQAITVEMRVQFPGGTPLVWWPATETPSITDNGLGQPPKNEKAATELAWRLDLQKSPNPNLVKPPPMKEVGSDHWIKALRDVKCDTVAVLVGERGFGSEFEQEQFVYYDGLMPRGKGAAIKVEKDRVSLTNEAKHPLFDVTVIDRQTPDKPRIVRVAKLDAGATEKVDWQDASEGHWPQKAAQTLQDQLKDAGLNDDEAKSLVVVWTHELFEADGVTLFYRLPQEEYDRLLPLTLTPRPEKVVRVGLVHQPHCEPGVAERVARLVKQLDDDEFAKREAAQKELEQLGHAAFPHLVKLRPTVTAPEPKRRIEELLEKYDVERAVKK